MSFWHTFKDNPKAREEYLLKMRIIKLVRTFFDDRGFQEFEAPILQPGLIPESYLDIFDTEERRIGLEGKFSRPLYMLTSPESFQKKMMVAGFDSNYAITKSFRNGEALSGKHLSEFTLLEWYEKNRNYVDVMQTTEDLFHFILQELEGPAADSIQFQGKSINIVEPWLKKSVNELFVQYTDIDLEDSYDETVGKFSVQKLAQLAEKFGFNVMPETTWEELFHQIWLTHVEPNLQQDVPVIIYDYPHELSPLAKPKSGQKTAHKIWAERFEVMIAGLEICDTYTENTDFTLQEKTFAAEIEHIKHKGKREYGYDYEFIEALKLGLPESSGNALGLDRMVMLFGDVKDISVFDLSR